MKFEVLTEQHAEHHLFSNVTPYRQVNTDMSNDRTALIFEVK
jgi:hypothetical protein